MKKIVVLFALFLILGANIYWDCIDSTGNLSELQLANIEALASGELPIRDLEKKKNVMAADIKWCVVPLTPNHVLTLIVINFFFYAFVLILSRIWTRQLKPYLNYSLMIVLVKNEK